MSNPLKVHDLVALMNVAIGSQAHHTPRQNHIPVANITGGLLNYDEGKERTFPILDALASISVSDPKTQVVAIALQLQLKYSKVCLTVAENEKVKDGLVQYLHEVWSMLRVCQASSDAIEHVPVKRHKTSTTEEFHRSFPRISQTISESAFSDRLIYIRMPKIKPGWINGGIVFLNLWNASTNLMGQNWLAWQLICSWHS